MSQDIRTREGPGGGSRQRRKGLGLSCRVEKQPEDWPIWRNLDDSQVKADPRREAWVERAKG
jgi:hypothetical protein